ncbi:MAG TPA: hypothetical protein VJ889_08030, partial [Pseudomonas sp.]|nr:hypothetical protein [Pseudomonas sp.]
MAVPERRAGYSALGQVRSGGYFFCHKMLFGPIPAGSKRVLESLADKPFAVEIWRSWSFAYTAQMFSPTALRPRYAKWLIATGLFLMLSGCVDKPNTLERVKEDGVLRVVTR